MRKDEESMDRLAHPPKRARIEDLIIGSLQVQPYGLGTLPLGVEYPLPSRRPSRPAAISLLHAAFRSGVEILDTADSYYAGPGGSSEACSPHYVERVIAEAIRTYKGDTSRIRVCTKGGMRRVDSSSKGWRPKPCSAANVRQMILDSRDALGGHKPIDIYMLHHTDTLSTQQLEDALLAMRQAVQDGQVLCLGLANATISNLDLAERLGVEIAVVQNQYSLWNREAEMSADDVESSRSKKGMLSRCMSRGIAFMPYGVLGGAQHRSGRRSLAQDFPRLVALAVKKSASPETIVLAWMRQRFPCVVHIVGARNRQHILESVQAKYVSLSKFELEEISTMKPALAELLEESQIFPNSFVYFESGTLSKASAELLQDFQNDMQELGTSVGFRISTDVAYDRVQIRACDNTELLHMHSQLDAISKFYFEVGIPW